MSVGRYLLEKERLLPAIMPINISPRFCPVSTPAKAPYQSSLSRSYGYSIIRAGQNARNFGTTTRTQDFPKKPRNILSMADLKVSEIEKIVELAESFKNDYRTQRMSRADGTEEIKTYDTLKGKTIALLFNKRSTRTRVSSESGLALLGAHPMFLGTADIQLGVNESLYDSARVIGSMVDGVFARVADHSEVEALAEHSGVPVINALSSLYHPTQILADLLTLREIYRNRKSTGVLRKDSPLSMLNGLKVAWIGDANNMYYDMLLTFFRLGIDFTAGIPTKDKYSIDEQVKSTYMQAHQDFELEKGAQTATNTQPGISRCNDPKDAVKDADVLVTDTWISMGQESEKAERLKDFAGYQITESLAKEGGAKPDWKFMHCLPRKEQEVDDEVFFGDRSVVFQEAENRKWSFMALAYYVFSGKSIL